MKNWMIRRGLWRYEIVGEDWAGNYTVCKSIIHRSDAAMISAAPDMAAALIALLELSDVRDNHTMSDMASRALSKAKP